MKFSEQLDFLMKITNTTNNTLARAISLDASFVSRLRNGVRAPSKNQNYVDRIANFFARNILDDYQKAALCKKMDIEFSSFPKQKDLLKELIEKWMNQSESGGALFTQLDRMQQAREDSYLNRDQNNGAIEAVVLYGKKGRRDAVTRLLNLMLENKYSDILYLMCDGNLEWMTEDPVCFRTINMLLYQVISMGKKIKVIHTLDYNLNNMSSLVNIWLSFYVSGGVEPYYYPNMKDGLMKNTLMAVVPKTAAAVSLSVSENVNNSANVLLTDKKAVAFLEHEFNCYLSKCRPLLKELTIKNKRQYFHVLSGFEYAEADLIMRTNIFTGVVMPDNVLKRILSRIESLEKEKLLSVYQGWTASFLNTLKKFKITEVIALPNTEDVKSGRIPASFLCGDLENQFCYTKEEYCLYLKQLITYLENYKNYNVCIADMDIFSECFVLAKKGMEVLMSSIHSRKSVFSISEDRMVEAIWRYFEFKVKEKEICSDGKATAIRRIKYLIDEVEG